MNTTVVTADVGPWQSPVGARPTAERRVAVGALVWLLTACITYVLFAPIPTSNVMAAASVAACGWAGLMALWVRTRGALTPSGILIFVAGPFFLGMPLLQLTVERYSDYHIDSVASSFLLASVAVLAYLVAFAIGTVLGRSAGARSAQHVGGVSRRRVRQVVRAYLFVGAAGWFWYFHAMGGLRYFLDNLQNRTQLASGLGYLFLVATLLQVGTLIAAAFSAAKQPVVSRPFLVILVVASTALILMVGMRSRAIMFIGMIAIAAHALGRRVSGSQWIALGGLGVVSLVVIGQVRELGSGTGAILSSKEVTGVVQADVDRLIQQAVVDYGHFDRLSLTQEYVPARVPWQYGKTFIAVLGAPVPRALWPAKPLGAGPLLANAFRPGAWDLDEGWASGVTPTIIGELFLNLSWFGILVGGLAIGALAGWAHRKFELKRESVWATVSYVVFLVLFLASGTLGEFYGTVMMYGIYAVPIALAAIYSRVAAPR